MTHYVYTAWNASADPVYVGCTNNLARRMDDHRNKWWQPEVAFISWELFDDKAEAFVYEADRIREIEPLCNRRGNPRFYRWLEGGAA